VPAFINRWIQETLKPIAQYALRRASALACLSTYSKTRSLEMAPRARAEIVPNGVDTSQFYPPTDAKARGIEKRFISNLEKQWMPPWRNAERQASVEKLRLGIKEERLLS